MLDACGGCRYYELRLQATTVKCARQGVLVSKQVVKNKRGPVYRCKMVRRKAQRDQLAYRVGKRAANKIRTVTRYGKTKVVRAGSTPAQFFLPKVQAWEPWTKSFLVTAALRRGATDVVRFL